MNKYNIYKIKLEQRLELLKKLEKVGLIFVSEQEIDGHKLSFYLSKNPEEVPIWWAQLYSQFIPKDKSPKNSLHSAVFLIANESYLYAVSMGKAHFYLRDYCDEDFGINLAMRIADPNECKMRSSRFFGSKKHKVIVSYQNLSEMDFDAGESVDYIRVKTVQPDIWGKSARFGVSVQFCVSYTPIELPQLLGLIEEQLNKQAKVKIPKAIKVEDLNKKKELNTELTQAILNHESAALHPTEFVVSGIEFVFSDFSKYSFGIGSVWKDVEGEFGIESLLNFLNENQIDLLENLDKIKVRISDERISKFVKPLKFFLDYQNEERYVLKDGEWFFFSQDFIDLLEEQVDRIDRESSVGFSVKEYNQNVPEEKRKEIYKEKYFNACQESEGYRNLDRDIEELRDKYKIEKLDLLRGKTAFFVKMGTPQKISYVFDQASATIRVLKNNLSQIEVDGKITNVDKMCVWILLDRRNEIKNISDIESIIFLMKLNDWRKECSNAGYVPVIRIGYILE